MPKLMVSVSGIRGIVGDSLTPEVITKYTYAFIKLVGKGSIIVAKDSRVTGDMVESFVIGALLSAGCKVIQLGIVPTPTAEIMVVEKKANGGIIISASHNPPQWNALKFVGNDGMFLRKDLVDKINRFYKEETMVLTNWDSILPIETNSEATSFHINKILSLPIINVKALQGRKFRIVLDNNHGAGGLMGKEFLERIGCEIITIGLEPTGNFLHPCEPLPENIQSLCNKVLETKSDIGFAIDPDGDRVAIVSEKGLPIGEEYTLAFATKCVLEKKRGPITLNLSTSSMAEDIAESYGCKCFRTPVGEINVSSAMKKNGSVIGGEGNGGAMLPEVLYGRDAYVGMILCLQYLAESKKTVSEAIADFPSFAILKEKTELGSLDADMVLQQIEGHLPSGKVNKDDGLRISWPDSWVHIRKSNTEHILRFIVEARTEKKAQELLKNIYRIIKEL